MHCVLGARPMRRGELRKKKKKSFKVVRQSCCSHKKILCKNRKKKTAVLALGQRGEGEGKGLVHRHYFLRSTITSMDNTESTDGITIRNGSLVKASISISRCIPDNRCIPLFHSVRGMANPFRFRHLPSESSSPRKIIGKRKRKRIIQRKDSKKGGRGRG